MRYYLHKKKCSSDSLLIHNYLKTKCYILIHTYKREQDFNHTRFSLMNKPPALIVRTVGGAGKGQPACKKVGPSLPPASPTGLTLMVAFFKARTGMVKLPFPCVTTYITL